MKKLLILAYDFPPYVSVGGLRPYAWYKYLKEYDVFPIVVTRQWENKHRNKLDYIISSGFDEIITEKTKFGELIRAPYRTNLANKIMLKYGENKFKFIRKIISAYYEFFQWFFLIGPKSELYFAAKKYLKNNKSDLIIATGDPFILFRYATILSKKFNIPWIADYRDIWVKNSKVEPLNFYFKKKYSKTAKFIITVSSVLEKQISKTVKNKDFFIIPNGFDPETIDSAKSIIQISKKFKIVLAGTIYKWHPIKSFLKVCDELMKEKEIDLTIEFYGINIEDQMKKWVTQQFINLKSCIKIIPKIPNSQLLIQLSDANVFLLFNYYAFMGTKIYDYIALNRKILFCYSDDEDAELLKQKYYKFYGISSINDRLQEKLITETNSGIIVKNKEHLRLTLKELYNEFKNTGMIKNNSTSYEKYSRKYQTEKLAEIIKNI